MISAISIVQQKLREEGYLGLEEVISHLNPTPARDLDRLDMPAPLSVGPRDEDDEDWDEEDDEDDEDWDEDEEDDDEDWDEEDDEDDEDWDEDEEDDEDEEEE